MRGTPLTSSGAICVPSSDRQGRPASCAAWYTVSDLPTPGGASRRKLCSWAMHWMSFFACCRVIVSSSGPARLESSCAGHVPPSQRYRQARIPAGGIKSTLRRGTSRVKRFVGAALGLSGYPPRNCLALASRQRRGFVRSPSFALVRPCWAPLSLARGHGGGVGLRRIHSANISCENTQDFVHGFWIEIPQALHETLGIDRAKLIDRHITCCDPGSGTVPAMGHMAPCRHRGDDDGAEVLVQFGPGTR